MQFSPTPLTWPAQYETYQHVVFVLSFLINNHDIDYYRSNFSFSLKIPFYVCPLNLSFRLVLSLWLMTFPKLFFKLVAVSKLRTPCRFPIMSTVSFTVGHKNSSIGNVDISKMSAAHEAIDKHVKDGMTLGIGSGSTIVYGIQRLAQRMKDESLTIVCVPTSYQARQLIIDNNLPLGTLDEHPKLDCTIDGADEIETGTLACIKGGGGCLTQEKIVASCSEKLIIVADGAKEVSSLGQKWKKGIPIEVLPMACKPVQNKIEVKYGGEAILRMSADKAGPLVTDNGNFILDWVFPDIKYCWSSINNYIKLIPGVIEIGLFIDMADECLVGDSKGNVRLLKKSAQSLEI